MALSKDIVIRLLGDASSAEKAIKSAADAAEVSVAAYKRAEREQTRQAAAAEAAAKKQMAAYESVGRGMMITGAVIAAGLGLSAKAAIDWESAWAGVMKTVDGSPEQMNQLEASLRQLATTLPATHEEIAGVAEAAGQLGVARGDIVEFTKVAIAMGVSTNLSAQDAATGMARLSNIMGTSNKDVDRMGSALVALGNAGASTEGEILDMSLRIAAAGRQAGMSEGEVMGLANAMSSLGIEAEAGGTAISTVIKKINSSVLDGGDALDEFARVAGMSSSAFATAWREDAASALVTVVQGLGRMQAQGENVNTVIDELGLDGIRTSDTLLRLAGNSDGLADSLALGNKAWAENNALMNEANKRYETTSSQIAIARNQITDAAIDIGGTLLPILASGTDMIADFARGFQELPDWMQGSVAAIGLLAATVGILGGAAVIAVPKIAAFRLVMESMVETPGRATTAMGKLGLFMTGPWGAAIGAATLGLGVLITWLGSTSRASQEAEDYQRDLADALRDTGGVIDETVRAMAAQKAEDSKFKNSSLLEWAEKVGVEGSKVTDALLGNKGAYEEITAAIDVYAQAQMDAAIANGTSDTLDMSWVPELKGQYEGLANGMGGAVAENQRLADATEATGGAAKNTTGTMDSLAQATGDVAVAGQDAATAAEKLADAMDALNGPTLDVREATRNYKDELAKIAAAMEEEGWTKTLDQNTQAGRDNAEMLDDLAKKGMEQANAIAASGGSYDAFHASLESSRDALIQTAVDMGLTKEEALALANQILQIPDAASVDIQLPTYGQVTQQLIDVYNRVAGIPPETWTNVGVISQSAIDALEDVGYKTNTLPDGTVEVYADTGPARNELARLTSARYSMTVVANLLGVPGSAYGGPVMGFAAGGAVRGPGGPRDDMVAAIGPRGGAYRLSNNEHIVTSDEVNGAGGHAAVMAQRRLWAQGSRGYAAGGGIGIPVASSGHGGTLAIDYDRLGAVMAAASRGMTIEKIVTERNETGYELAERLAFTARTGG